MCNLSDGIERRGVEKGIDLNSIESIQNLMNNLYVGMNEAMDLLNVPIEKRKIYGHVIVR